MFPSTEDSIIFLIFSKAIEKEIARGVTSMQLDLYQVQKELSDKGLDRKTLVGFISTLIPYCELLGYRAVEDYDLKTNEWILILS